MQTGEVLYYYQALEVIGRFEKYHGCYGMINERSGTVSFLFLNVRILALILTGVYIKIGGDVKFEFIKNGIGISMDYESCRSDGDGDG